MKIMNCKNKSIISYISHNVPFYPINQHFNNLTSLEDSFWWISFLLYNLAQKPTFCFSRSDMPYGRQQVVKPWTNTKCIPWGESSHIKLKYPRLSAMLVTLCISVSWEDYDLINHVWIEATLLTLNQTKLLNHSTL